MMIAELSADLRGLHEPLSEIIGRADELVAAAELVARRRLVTVAGPAGVGKTRLACEVAWRTADWMTDGSALVELAGVSDPRAVPAAMATALGVPEIAVDGPVEALASALAHREVLVVVDNCEHVLDAVADVVTELLMRTTGMHLLATSREPLRVDGESVFRLDPFPVLDDDAGSGAAVALLVARAREVNRTFAAAGDELRPLVELVRRLDGLPLAIEIVAAHASAFTAAEMLQHLATRPELFVSGRRKPLRHRSLQASIEWSEALLTERQKLLWHRLSVFAGGWSLVAAEAVCAAPGDLSETEAGALLIELVEKSLVTARPSHDGTRYHLLDTLRHFCAQRLESSGDADTLRAAHLRWLLDIAADADARSSPERGDALQGMRAELDNVDAALAWAVTHEPSGALQLATHMGSWWRTAGRLSDGRRWLETAVAANPTAAPAARAKALIELGLVMQDQVDPEGSLDVHRRALHAVGPAGDAGLICRAMLGMALALRDLGNYGEAATVARTALDTARAKGDRAAEARALATLAFIAVYRNDSDEARGLGEAAVECLGDDDTTEAAWEALAAASVANCWAGALEVAEARSTRLLKVAEHRGSSVQISWAHSMIATVAGHRRDAQREFEHARTAIQLADAIGANRARAVALMDLNEALGLLGNYDLAATFAGAAAAVVSRRGLALPPGMGQYLRLDDFAKAHGLDPSPLEPAYQRGQNMADEEVLALALAVTANGPIAAGHPRAEFARLSKRERELLTLLSNGLTDAQIATQMIISIRTVRSHLDRIRDKTGARRRADLTRLAAALGHAES